MTIMVGKGCFPVVIDDSAILDTVKNDAPVALSIWQKIKEFFCRTNHTEAMLCLHKLCHPRPEVTQSDTKALFLNLRELASPGFEDFFLVDESDGILVLRIMDATDNALLAIRFGNDYSIEWKGHIRYNFVLNG
ncbi:hypothetical protein VL10_24505 [Leclercia adecarboxylata]|nr:hypothetical protein VL10_24505 [Leclercia adecarboxylata]KMN59509.1 hypothetical protein VK95_24470 [Leclercia sp. LK8]